MATYSDIIPPFRSARLISRLQNAPLVFSVLLYALS